MTSHRWRPSPTVLKPVNRDPAVSKALQAYAALATSADRDLDQLK